MAVKKISEFPVVEAVNIHIFGRQGNKNVQTILDIKQDLFGRSATSTVSQAAVAAAIDEVNELLSGDKIPIGRAIEINNSIVVDKSTSIADTIDNIIVNIGRITLTSTNESIEIKETTTPALKVDLKVNIGRILSSKSGLKESNGTIVVDIDEKEDNNLYLTSDGKLRSDNKWKNWKY